MNLFLEKGNRTWNRGITRDSENKGDRSVPILSYSYIFSLCNITLCKIALLLLQQQQKFDAYHEQ